MGTEGEGGERRRETHIAKLTTKVRTGSGWSQRSCKERVEVGPPFPCFWGPPVSRRQWGTRVGITTGDHISSEREVRFLS